MKDKPHLCPLLHVLTSTKLLFHCSSDLPCLILQLPSGHICLQGELKLKYKESISVNNIYVSYVFLWIKAEQSLFHIKLHEQAKLNNRSLKSDCIITNKNTQCCSTNRLLPNFVKWLNIIDKTLRQCHQLQAWNISLLTYISIPTNCYACHIQRYETTAHSNGVHTTAIYPIFNTPVKKTQVFNPWTTMQLKRRHSNWQIFQGKSKYFTGFGQFLRLQINESPRVVLSEGLTQVNSESQNETITYK